jgi:hypothetical protein
MAPASVWSVQSHVCSPRVSRLGAHQGRVATLAQRDPSACVAAVRPTADLGQYRCHTKTGSATGSAHFRRPCAVCRKTLPLLTRRWHLSRSIAAAEIHAQEASSASPVAAFFPTGTCVCCSSRIPTDFLDTRTLVVCICRGLLQP